MLRALLPQLCLTLCDPMDSRPPGSSVHGFSRQEYWGWISLPSSRGSSWPRDRTLISCVSCIAGGFFTHCATWEAFKDTLLGCKEMHSNHREVSGRSWPSCCVNLKPGQRGFPLGQKDSHKFARDAGRIYLRDELFGSFPYKWAFRCLGMLPTNWLYPSFWENHI